MPLDGCASPTPAAMVRWGPTAVTTGRPWWSPSASPRWWPDSTAVITVPWTRNERGATGLKTTSYAENVVALARARERGASEALFANTVGQLCEGTGSNVFVVLDGEIHTPPLASGCLAGITRAFTVEWTGAKETDLPLDVLERADEVLTLDPAGRPGRAPRRRARTAGRAGAGDRQGHADLRRAAGRPRSVRGRRGRVVEAVPGRGGKGRDIGLPRRSAAGRTPVMTTTLRPTEPLQRGRRCLATTRCA
ncbi:hypothetical protein SALBM311S_12258 [Streptomyces alboniger]